eukprot:TRINITY_DN6019_c0_g2_i1.p2 TRINITY_DN6019_c0_g2~~TRINITY_DN6019_c0_g2_i1.p2  ORF type:complete len:132 (-),score=12.51 TRINITY_DN6019_c0_g2_i1:356-751(-)
MYSICTSVPGPTAARASALRTQPLSTFWPMARAPVLTRPLQHLQVPAHCSGGARAGVPMAPVRQGPLQRLEVPVACSVATVQLQWQVIALVKQAQAGDIAALRAHCLRQLWAETVAERPFRQLGADEHVSS